MKKVLTRLNYPLLILTILYSIFGCLMIYSASSISAILRYDVSTGRFVFKQIISSVLAYTAGIVVLFIPTKKYRFPAILMLAVTYILLIGVFIYGKIAGGSLSWFDLGKLSFQPSEFAKPVLIIYLASYYYKLSFKKNITLFNMIFPLLLVLVMFIAIALQPDLGSACIIMLISVFIFFSIPLAKKQKMTIYKMGAVGVVLILILLPTVGKNILHGYQVQRLLEFRHPCTRYQEDTGYQVCNAYIAIHNGGAFGVGLGNSTQKYLYLPESHTDFIFPIICEECGLIVGIIVLIGYFIFLMLILSIAKTSITLKNSIISYGIFTYFAVHIIVNILGVLGLIPLTGVPLPFLSYGGTFNICVIMSVFVLERISYENKIDKEIKKIKEL